MLSFYYYNLKNYLVSKWCYSLNNKSFKFDSPLNPDSSICINCHYSTWLHAIFRLCFSEDTFFSTSTLSLTL